MVKIFVVETTGKGKTFPHHFPNKSDSTDGPSYTLKNDEFFIILFYLFASYNITIYKLEFLLTKIYIFFPYIPNENAWDFWLDLLFKVEKVWLKNYDTIIFIGQHSRFLKSFLESQQRYKEL